VLGSPLRFRGRRRAAPDVDDGRERSAGNDVMSSPVVGRRIGCEAGGDPGHDHQQGDRERDGDRHGGSSRQSPQRHKSASESRPSLSYRRSGPRVAVQSAALSATVFTSSRIGRYHHRAVGSIAVRHRSPARRVATSTVRSPAHTTSTSSSRTRAPVSVSMFAGRLSARTSIWIGHQCLRAMATRCCSRR